jgi:hypothetical protein
LGKYIYNDIFVWDGWGGKLKLGNGKCRLQLLDLEANDKHGLRHLRPYLAIVTDVIDSQMSVKSCAGHIATRIIQTFNIDPHRLLYLEYYPETSYGSHADRQIVERFESVEFIWKEEKAINPRWRTFGASMAEKIKNLLERQQNISL